MTFSLAFSLFTLTVISSDESVSTFSLFHLFTFASWKVKKFLYNLLMWEGGRDGKCRVAEWSMSSIFIVRLRRSGLPDFTQRWAGNLKLSTMDRDISHAFNVQMQKMVNNGVLEGWTLSQSSLRTQ